MGHAYSLDLRERISGYIARGGSRRAAARHFGVSASTAVRIAARLAERGTLEPRRIGRPPGRGKLAPYVDFLVEIVEAAELSLDDRPCVDGNSPGEKAVVAPEGRSVAAQTRTDVTPAKQRDRRRRSGLLQ
jgi:hypothetical protein